MTVEEKALEAVRLFLIDLRKRIRKELTDQGHVSSGDLINQIQIKLLKSVPLEGRIEMLAYAEALDEGVPSQNVAPEGVAKYIQGLEKWLAREEPGMLPAERTEFSYNILRKASEVGHPLPGAYEFSSNGRRTEWSKYTVDVVSALDIDFGSFIDFTVEKILGGV